LAFHQDCRIGGDVLLSGLPNAKILAAGLSSVEKCLAAVGPTVDYNAAVTVCLLSFVN
jgi:hypothetical protein